MITAKIDGDLRRVMATQLRTLEQSVAAAVATTAEDTKADLRRQTLAGGLGQKLANAWRSRFYPNNGTNAAAVIHTRAPTIMGAFATGATIRARNAVYLAIPTAAVPKQVLGKRVTPALLERAWGIRLRFIYRAGRASLLIADQRGKAVPLFILVHQATLKKRIDMDAATAWAAARLKAALMKM